MTETTLGGRRQSLLLEFFVIILGVLVALAADSWWQSRQDEARADAYLLALQADLNTARSSLDERIAFAEEQREQALSTVRLLQARTPAPDESVRLIGWDGFPNLPLGTMEALVATGDIGLVGDPLRSAIVTAHSFLMSERGEMELRYAWATSNLQDCLAAFAYLWKELSLPVGPVPAEAARNSPELVAVYLQHFGMLQNHIDTLNRMMESVTGLEGSLLAYLGNGQSR